MFLSSGYSISFIHEKLKVDLSSGTNDFPALPWKFEPPHDAAANPDIQQFFEDYLITTELLPLSLRVDGPHMLCGDRSKSPRLVLEATMEGIGACIVSRVHVSLGFRLFSNLFYFKFQFCACVSLICVSVLFILLR